MKGNILIISEDKKFLEMIENLLQKEGYIISCVSNQEEAIKKTKEQLYDLILMDALLQQDDEYFNQHLKTFQPKARSIILSSPSVESIPTEEIKEYIAKTSSPEELVKNVKVILEDYWRKKEKEALERAVAQEHLKLIKNLVEALESRDAFKKGHSQRVAHLAVTIGKAFQLTKSSIESLRLAAYFHDLGEIKISPEIMNQARALTPEEWKEIKQCPLIAKEWMEPISSLRQVVPIILYHHERWDGQGYPEGLSGDNIPFEARILSVANVYDALTSPRRTRPAYSEKEALNIIKENAGTQFDPRIVEVFEQILNNKLEEEEPVTESLKDTFKNISTTQAKSLISLGFTYLEAEDFEQAFPLFHKILEIEEELIQHEILIETYGGLAIIYWKQGDYMKALENIEKAINIAQEHGNSYLLAKMKGTKGLILIHLMRYKQAEDILLEAKKLFHIWENNYELTRITLFLSHLYSQWKYKEELLWEAMKEWLQGVQKGNHLSLLFKERRIAIPILLHAICHNFQVETVGLFLEKLGKIAISPLKALAEHPEPDVRMKALKILKKFATEEDLEPFYTDPDEQIKNYAQQVPHHKETQDKIRIFTLGSLAVYWKGELINEKKWKTRKTKHLLAYLLTQQGRPVAEDVLIEIFWHDFPLKKAKHNLRDTVYLLRRVLEPELKKGSQSRYILYNQGNYRLQMDTSVWCDLNEFTVRFTQGKNFYESEHFEEALVEFQEAEQLYRGDFLEDLLYEEWTFSERARLKEIFIELLLYIWEYYFQREKYEIALNYIRKVLHKEKTHEQGQYALVKTLWKMGKRDEAIKTYHRACSLLKEEFNLPPSQKLVKLYYQIVGQK